MGRQTKIDAYIELWNRRAWVGQDLEKLDEEIEDAAKHLLSYFKLQGIEWMIAGEYVVFRDDGKLKKRLLTTEEKFQIEAQIICVKLRLENYSEQVAAKKNYRQMWGISHSLFTERQQCVLALYRLGLQKSQIARELNSSATNIGDMIRRAEKWEAHVFAERGCRSIMEFLSHNSPPLNFSSPSGEEVSNVG